MPLIEAMLMTLPPPALKHGAADHLGADEAMREIKIDEAPPRYEVALLDRDVDVAPADVVDENIDRHPFGQHASA
jgi:hypothetical protein